MIDADGFFAWVQDAPKATEPVRGLLRHIEANHRDDFQAAINTEPQGKAETKESLRESIRLIKRAIAAIEELEEAFAGFTQKIPSYENCAPALIKGDGLNYGLEDVTPLSRLKCDFEEQLKGAETHLQKLKNHKKPPSNIIFLLQFIFSFLIRHNYDPRFALAVTRLLIFYETGKYWPDEEQYLREQRRLLDEHGLPRPHRKSRRGTQT